ncbi:MAG: hypothetical protein AB1894_18305 [Chloroflexota bacterium]
MSIFPYKRNIDFPNGFSAQAIESDIETEPKSIFECLDLEVLPKAVIPISGGATHFPPEIFVRIRPLMKAVVELAFERQIMLVDGGTKQGVMEIVGDLFRKARVAQKDLSYPPLVGFVPEFKISYPGASTKERDPQPSELDPNHPYFVLIHGAYRWGEEVKCMFGLVNYLSFSLPSVALIVNGGLTTLLEVVYSIQQNRQIIVFDGTHRVAKVICSALDGASNDYLISILKGIDPVNPVSKNDIDDALLRLDQIKNYQGITRFNLGQPIEELIELVLSKLSMIE